VTVYLVGAGPGDPGLLTVRGASLLAAADVVIHDRLASASVLDLAPSGALRIDVGKRPGGPLQQESINALLVEYGRSLDSTVIRLKGGDPFVFGRGGEEAQALLEAEVAFEVVPGVSSAIAAPAYAGVPVTHRGLSTSLTVVTGHSRHAVDVETNWSALAQAGGTIVVLMGVAHRAEIASRLLEGGLPADTPVAAVHWGTRPDQVTVRATLAGLGSLDLSPPVTLVIGAVAGLDLSWFERRPLFGRRIVVTRAREGSALVEALAARGAACVEVPTIAFTDPGDGGAALRAAASRVASYDWVVFASATAVSRFCACLRDARAFGAARVAAVGPGTAAKLATFGVAADLTPASAVAESLVRSLGAGPGRVLVPRSATGRDVLPDGLRAAGWEVDAVEAYRTVPVAVSDAVVAEIRAADVVTFTSSSTVTNLVAAVGVAALPPLVACIGPVTAATATAAGLNADIVASPHTIEGLVNAVTERLGQRSVARS
jgi:uroporphyrinogen III methyltransferase/synthase